MMLYKVLSRLDRSRFNPVVISLREGGPIAEKITALGIEVYSLGVKSARFSFSGLYELIKIAHASKAHIIQGWMYHGNIAAQLTGIVTRSCVAVLWNVRQSLYSLSHEKKFTAAVIKTGSYLSSLPDRIIYNSRVSAMQHSFIGYCSREQVIIPNGFDVTVFKPCMEAKKEMRAELKISDNAVLIGLVGRYHPMKDHRTFLSAASILARTNPAVHYVLVGEQVDYHNKELIHIIKEFNIADNVHLLGSRDDMPRVTAAFDIASCTSYSEGFPNVVGEAMSSGIPCAVTDVGDAAWIVADTGKVVPPRNPSALADAWQQLIDMGVENRSILGMKARQRITDTFSLDTVVRQYESIYEELILS